MKVWMIQVAATDGWEVTEGPFISYEYVTKDSGYNDLDWRPAVIWEEDYEVYYAETNVNGVITGYTLYKVEVEGS